MRKLGVENVETKHGRYLDLQIELDEVMREIQQSVPQYWMYTNTPKPEVKK